MRLSVRHPIPHTPAQLPAGRPSGGSPVKRWRVVEHEDFTRAVERRPGTDLEQVQQRWHPRPRVEGCAGGYANLIGGELYEPHEENPMIGYRGASRYLSADFADCFAMECDALRYVRDDMGLTNVKIMIPFVRTIAEAKGVIALLTQNGLRRGENDLQVIMMCELPQTR